MENILLDRKKKQVKIVGEKTTKFYCTHKILKNNASFFQILVSVMLRGQVASSRPTVVVRSMRLQSCLYLGGSTGLRWTYGVCELIDYGVWSVVV